MSERAFSNLKTQAFNGVSAGRRGFLKNLAGASLVAFGVPDLAEAAIKRFHSHKTLAFENINTGDTLKLTYFERGNYLKDALKEINYVFRDFHTGDTHPIDPALLDQLYDLKLLLGTRKPYHILSGYRSPFTNAILRKRSHGVAKNSLHMQGRAIDIRMEGISTKTIRNAAIAMGRGGVGFYPHSDFVHLDTGSVRIW
jgi:uncharacterized protein YcbK (DUF882 family)